MTTTDRIHAPLRAYACHTHTNDSDLCFHQHDHWLVTVDETDELVQLIPFTQAADESTLRQYLRLCDYRGPLTVDDA